MRSFARRQCRPSSVDATWGVYSVKVNAPQSAGIRTGRAGRGGTFTFTFTVFYGHTTRAGRQSSNTRSLKASHRRATRGSIPIRPTPLQCSDALKERRRRCGALCMIVRGAAIIHSLPNTQPDPVDRRVTATARSLKASHRRATRSSIPMRHYTAAKPSRSAAGDAEHMELLEASLRMAIASYSCAASAVFRTHSQSFEHATRLD